MCETGGVGTGVLDSDMFYRRWGDSVGKIHGSDTGGNPTPIQRYPWSPGGRGSRKVLLTRRRYPRKVRTDSTGSEGKKRVSGPPLVRGVVEGRGLRSPSLSTVETHRKRKAEEGR